MTKAEFIALVAEKSGLSKKDAGDAVNAFGEAVTDVLSKGDKITLPGFGTFETSERAARKGHNPQTKAEIDIPAATVPKFKAGSALKAAVNK